MSNTSFFRESRGRKIWQMGAPGFSAATYICKGKRASRFTDVVLRMYGAGSAGISVQLPACRDHAEFVRQAVSGGLTAHQACAADRIGAARGDYCSQRSVDGAAMLPPSSSQMLTARRWRFLSTPRRLDWPSMGRRLGGPTKRGLDHGFGLQGPQNRCRGCASSFPVMIRRIGALPSVQYRHIAAVSDLGRSSVRALTNLAPQFAVVYDCAHRPFPPGPAAAAACRQLTILVRTTSLRRCRQGTSNA